MKRLIYIDITGKEYLRIPNINFGDSSYEIPFYLIPCIGDFVICVGIKYRVLKRVHDYNNEQMYIVVKIMKDK